MRKRALGLLLGVCSCLPLAAQVRLEGAVIDSSSGATLPFVAVRLAGTESGTLTNENGQFALVVPQLPVVLEVRSLGYCTQQFRIQQAGQAAQLRLPPHDVQIATVQIREDYATELVRKAAQKHLKTIRNDYARGFYRQMSQINGEVSEVFEVLYNLQLTGTEIGRWHIA